MIALIKLYPPNSSINNMKIFQPAMCNQFFLIIGFCTMTLMINTLKDLLLK